MPERLNTPADQPFFFSTSTMPPVAVGIRPSEVASSPGDDLVSRARRELSEIIREVTALSRQPISSGSFFAGLLDRVVCAIAASGGVIWDCRSPVPCAISRTGKYTDASIPGAGHAAHQTLLREVAANQTPVVVPSTPDAADPNLPSNPSPYPAAIVPIVDLARDVSQGASGNGGFVIVIFLEPEAGVATLRGYLRFVTQMSDLASEFLRADELRQSRRSQSIQRGITDSLLRLHELKTARAVAAELVDSAADLFSLSRVTLARINTRASRRRAMVLAVSHVETIDRRGETCKRLEAEIGQCVMQCPAIWFDGASRPAPDESGLIPLGAIHDGNDRHRLWLQVHQADHALTHESPLRQAIADWSASALAIHADRLTFESIPGATLYTALSPNWIAISPSTPRRLVTCALAIVLVAWIALLPTPMMVTAPATLRPTNARTHYAPSDAVIESVDVRHGQSIHAGDTLLRLRDWSIEEQLTTLKARRAVVTQRLDRSISSLVETPPAHPSVMHPRGSRSDDDLVQQQRLLEEESLGLDNQIECLVAAIDRLTIRADRDGTIDAWQTELTATGRPVRRGDWLVRVIPRDATWMADAKIHSSRAAAVIDQWHDSPDQTFTISTLARPDQIFDASVARCGIGAQSSRGHDSQVNPTAGVDDTTMAVELKIEGQGDADPSDQWTYGAPATVTIRCANRPLVEVVFYDLIRAIKRTWATWA